MSEKEPQLHSPENSAEQAESNAEQREKLKELLEKAEQEPGNNEDSIEKLRNRIEEEAVSGKEKSAGEHQADKKEPGFRIDKTAKNDAYKKTLKSVRHKLPRRQRAFSKVIHQPTVEKISEVGSKTVARPSALLSAGFFAFIGTTAIVWISRYYGFRYNFFVYIVLLIGGFLFGLLAEAAWRGARKISHKS